MLMSMAERDVAMERPDVSCLDCVNSLFFCFGPVHQFDRYYKDGHFDNCQKKFTELSFCFKLKAAGREEAKAMVKQLLAADDSSPTLGKVWQAKPQSRES